jgi:hypothetical protein
MTVRRSVADHSRGVSGISAITVGAFAGPAARLGRPWQAIVPAGATARLKLVAFGPARTYRSGRRHSSFRHAALVPIAAWYDRRRPRDRILLARWRTKVFGRARPAMRRLLITKLVVAIGRKQVLAVVGALIPELAARLVRPALGAVIPELIGRQPARLIATGIAELIGSRRASHFGASIMWLTGARIMWLTGARIMWLTAARIPWLTGARIPWLARARIPELTGTRILELIGVRRAWLITTGFPELVTTRIPELTGTWLAEPVRAGSAP